MTHPLYLRPLVNRNPAQSNPQLFASAAAAEPDPLQISAGLHEPGCGGSVQGPDDR